MWLATVPDTKQTQDVLENERQAAQRPHNLFWVSRVE